MNAPRLLYETLAPHSAAEIYSYAALTPLGARAMQRVRQQNVKFCKAEGGGQTGGRGRANSAAKD
jgi:hypothetical protein